MMQILVDLTEYKQLQEELSSRKALEERTAELQQINEQLHREIAAYQQIERIIGQEGIRLHEAVEALEKWRLPTRWSSIAGTGERPPQAWASRAGRFSGR